MPMKISQLGAALLAAAAILGSTNAGASMISYDTRAITTSFSTSDYKAGWAAQTSGIASSSLAAFNGPSSPGNSFSRLTVDFDVASPTSILFELGLDAGYGGEVWVDSTMAKRNTANLWWGSTWSNTSQILGTASFLLSTGHHVFTGFWAEDCCSGGQAGRFSTDNGKTWNILSVSNLDSLKIAAVPEPGILALFGIGLAGLAISRRKKAE